MQEISENGFGRKPTLPRQAMRNAVILPDGTKPVPLGSGVITALLGEGGMANVYEIWNSQLELHRAVKLIHPNCSEEAKQRFQTEIKITARLHHPNIIEIHGVGEWNGLPYIEMEKIEGITLEDLITERGALPIEVCSAIGIMISRALKFAHNQEYMIYGKRYHGVIHRDLKPSNIMVCKDGSVKLMDFGIARPTDASIHTTDGSVLGTLQYLSPEQLDGKPLDIRTDVYSLGTTLYEIVTGVRAFPERNVSRLMMDKVKNRFKPLDGYTVRLPARLRRLVHRCMQHDRDKRPRTAGHVLSELERIHGSMTLDSPEHLIRRTISTYASGKVILSTRHTISPRVVLAAGLIAGVSLVSTTVILKSLKDEPIPDEPAMAQPKEPATEQKAEPSAAKVATPSQPVIKEVAPPAKEPQVARTAPDPPKVSAPAPVRKQSLSEQLIERYGTEDLVDIIAKEVMAKSFSTALTLYGELPPEQAKSPKALIFKLRALVGTGDRGQLATFLANNSLDDGELYLAQARLAYDQNDLSATRRSLEAALQAPHAFMDYDQLKRDIYYYQALCASREFDASPAESTYKQALDAWYQLRSALRMYPNHPFNRKAVAETQRIGEKYRSLGG